MRLADDTRGRVPFALVAVLLLVGATTYGVTLATRGPATSDRRVDAAVERVDVAGSTAVRSAVAGAAESAATRPVVTPANTTAGRALDGDAPFRDALRLRIYVAVRSALTAVDYRRGSVVASASLPPTPNASALRAAKRRVAVASASDGAALRVTVDGVRVTARRDGRVVARESRTVNLTVGTPVLAMHRRTERYERLLDRDLGDGPGFGRRVTATVNGYAWARGQAQHYGAPFANVVATRHVEQAANGAALSLQERVYGRSDPDGRAGLRRAGTRAGLKTALAFSNADGEWADRVVPDPNAPTRRGVDAPAPQPNPPAATGNRTRTATAARVANRSIADFVHGDDDVALSVDEVIDRAYAAEARLAAGVERVDGGSRPAPEPPGPNATLVGTTTTNRTTVAGSPGDVRPPDHPRGWRVVRRVDRRVRVVYTVQRRWHTDDGVDRTDASWSETFDVAAAVIARPLRPAKAPDRPVEPAFERGGALDGPNLRGVPDVASARLLADNGGPEAVAAAAAEGRLPDDEVVVRGERPGNVSAWVRADVADLRERVADAAVTFDAAEAAAGGANPAATLANDLAARRASLVDAPRSYDGVAERARVDARAAYLELTIAHLRESAGRKRGADDRLRDVLGGHGLSARDLEAAVGAHERPPAPSEPPVSGPAGDVRLVPDAGPSYLATGALGDDRLPAVARGSEYVPLATRNLNLFTVPYGDVADEVMGLVPSRRDRLPLRSAARRLRAFDRASDLPGANVSGVAGDAATLRTGVNDSLRVVREDLRAALRRETALEASARRAAVRDAVGDWNGPAARALAATNGSLADATADAAVDRGAADRDRLAAALRGSLLSVRDDESTWVERPPASAVEREVRDALRGRIRGYVENRTETAANRLGSRRAPEWLSKAPAGLPVLPPAGGWYFTANVWVVEVRGAYARFVVRSDVGRADAPGSSIRYVRENATVRLDVDDDGRRERLGRNERLTFETRTLAVVAVAPTGTGVGDVDGVADETSAGWPAVGCRDDDCFPTRESDGRGGPADGSTPGAARVARDGPGGPGGPLGLTLTAPASSDAPRPSRGGERVARPAE